MCQARLEPILPSLRDRALRVQANAPGIRLVEPKRLLIEPTPSNKKNGRTARFVLFGGEGGIRTHGTA